MPKSQSHIKNKEKLLFWLLLSFLVICRIISIINARLYTPVEDLNLFISSHIASGVFPSPFLFQINQPHVGGGPLLYCTVAAPFIFLFGKSYFSLKLASIVFLILTYLITYRFCKRYFGLVATAFTSFLFVITPGLLTEFSIVGIGRHFHLNLFFILSLYCFSRIKDTKRFQYYLLLGITCGLGVYFYPAFLLTVFVLGLFLLFDIDIKKPPSVYGYIIIIICIIVGGEFLRFGTPWYDNFFKILFGGSKKNIIIQGDIFSILGRFTRIFLMYIPNTFAFSADNFSALFKEALFGKEYFNNLTTFSRISLEIFRLIFVTSCAWLGWINRKELKKAIFNVFPLRIKDAIPTNRYIAIFLLVHLFTYISFYSFNAKGIARWSYYTTLFLNIILIIAIFLNHIWQRNKSLTILLFIFALSPGIIHQYNNLTKAPPEDFYENYHCFFNEMAAREWIFNVPAPMLKHICDRLSINVCHKVGERYVRKDPAKVKKDFEYFSSGDIKKLRYLYQGYIYIKVTRSKGKIKERFPRIIENVDKKYRKFCYTGLGEGLFALVHFGKGEFDFEKSKNMIEKYSPFVKEAYRRSFFQGIGEGLARMFTRCYSSYVKDTGLYDLKIVEEYLKIIDDKECKKAFLTGFSNQDIWTPY